MTLNGLEVLKQVSNQVWRLLCKILSMMIPKANNNLVIVISVIL
jgi:hypothetical protein